MKDIYSSSMLQEFIPGKQILTAAYSTQNYSSSSLFKQGQTHFSEGTQTLHQTPHSQLSPAAQHSMDVYNALLQLYVAAHCCARCSQQLQLPLRCLLTSCSSCGRSSPLRRMVVVGPLALLHALGCLVCSPAALQEHTLHFVSKGRFQQEALSCLNGLLINAPNRLVAFPPQQKNSPLHLAVINNHLPVAKALLDANHDINFLNHVRKTGN